jgi:hypothetical protein
MIGLTSTSRGMCPPWNFDENGGERPDVSLFVDAVIQERL